MPLIHAVNISKGIRGSCILVTLALCACESSNGSGDDSLLTVVPPESLEESLTLLGVETEPSERLDSQGNEYPDDYAPLGEILTVRQLGASYGTPDEPEYVVGRPEELFLGGFRLDNGRQLGFYTIDDIDLGGLSDPQAEFTDPEVLEGRLFSEVPWAEEIGNGLPSIANVPSGTRRDAAALDTNGDGFLDAVVAYAEAQPGGGDEIRLQIIDGDGSTPVLDFSVLSGGSLLPAYDLRVAGGDFDGDGIDELAIAVARVPEPGLFDTPVGIYIVDDASTNFAVIDEHIIQYTASFARPYVLLEIDSFHADHDPVDELALVLNEAELFAPTPGNFASRHFVLELADGTLAEIAGGPISAEVYTPQGPRVANAAFANITTADLDGDSIDELIFGGLEDIVQSCVLQDSSTGEIDEGAHYVLFAFGGRHNDFSPIASGAAEVRPTDCRFESGSRPFVMRYVQINVLDFDADGDADIQINDLVLDDVPPRNWNDALIAFINDPSLIYGPETQHPYFDRSESAIAVSDQNGDGVEDIIALYQDPNDNDPYIKVYTFDSAADEKFRIATRIPVLVEDMFNKNPIILSTDVDNDKIAQLRYLGEHFLDITEPIVLAAIAAAPCNRDIEQDSCSSSWGNARTGAVGREFNVTVFGTAGAGAGSAGVGLLGKWLVKVSASASLITSSSYELTKSQTFSTGPFEDGVVFTSVPVDRFAYEVFRDNTDFPGTLGERIEIRLPRSPDIRIVERGYYNSSILPDAEPIDDRVFEHTPGNISSYPDEFDKAFILATQQTILDDYRRQRDPSFDYLPAERGLEVGPVLVGEGGGSTELALEYTETVGAGNAFTFGVSFEAEMLFGAAIQWEVGFEAGRTLSISHGDSTLFSGSVDNIPEPYYADNVYGFGLFAYLQKLGDQEIEVVNFWVEE